MEARNLRAALAASFVLLAAASLSAAGHRTENFVVTAASPQLAEEVGREAERFRKELAIEFLGHELSRWPATTVEHESEKEKQHQLLYRFLTTGRGIAFNQMFAMKEYPKDILPLYAQGFSLCKFFIAQGGKRKFVEYVGKGMETNNWTVTTREMYGYRSLSELQTTWLDWVRRGCPAIPAASEQLVSHETPSGGETLVPINSKPAADSAKLIEVAPQDRNPGTPPANALASGDGGSWYVRPAGTSAPPIDDARPAASQPVSHAAAPPTALPPLHVPARPAAASFAGPPPAANSALPHRLTGQHLPGKDLHWNSPIGKGALAASGGDGEQSVTRPQQPEQPRQIILEASRGRGPGNTILPPGEPPPRAAVLPQPDRVLR
jgi:hypothetical protein